MYISKIEENLQYKFSILIIVCVMLVFNFSVGAYSEEEYNRPEDMSFYEPAYSFALTDKYVLLTQAWGTEEYAWYPDTVRLDVMDISTGQTVSVAEFSSSWAQAFTDGKCFYFVESNYLNDNGESPFTISIGKIDPEKLEVEWLDTFTFGMSKSQWMETLTFDTKGYYADDWIRDIHIENGKMYFISYYKIYCCELSTLELTVVYQSEKRIVNRLFEDRSFIYKGKLYIHKEDGAIYEIDLTTFAERIVVYDAENLERDSNADIYTAPYSFYVFDDTLYYCNEIGYSKMTYALNLVDGRKTTIIESPVTFFLINGQGVYFDIYDGGPSRYFLDFSENRVTPIAINDFDILEIMIGMVR